MAVPRKFVVVPNSATRELWRIAESGEVHELAAVCAQADINARNEHGMTALMRAAYHGRVQMVRVLLEHGADANIMRNDKFTALSLAAFFGHAEIVEILMRHGAKTDVATRFDTSPQMWATARSFGDVARCLERREQPRQSASSISPTPAPAASSAPAATPTRAVSPATAPVVVRTLKDPPEIWDLVHEAPRNFNATTTFMARIHSMRGGFVLPVAALLILVGSGIGAVFFLKEAAPVSAVSRSTAPAPAVTQAPETSTQPIETSTQPSETNASPPEANQAVREAPALVNEPASSEVNTTTPRRSRSFARSRAISAEPNSEAETVQTAPAPPAVGPPQGDSRTSTNAETKKVPAPPNSQLISPPKSSQPKAKVIQWP